ncbi:MAG: hypothetical protein JNL57_00465 [Bacteroidetes bacterium]|nr:hypothetical protein [Bacteroidota bacterium]
MKKIIIGAGVLISGLFSLHAQQSEPCGYDKVIQQLEAQYPGFRNGYDKAYQNMLKPQMEVSSRKTKVRDTQYFYDTVYTIPVVFHVLYNNATENIHDSLLLSQIDVLNRDFRRRNWDTTNTRGVFKSRAGDTKIQFVLASKTPGGAATNGIVRKSTSQTTFGSSNGQITDKIKFSSQGGDDVWDPTKYLNIWVGDLYYPGSGNFLFGYAYPPYGHPNWPSNNWVGNPNQGVVLHYQIVGRNNPLATGTWAISFNGRTAVHEVGHFFGLRHIWGDAGFGNQCSVDDYIDDTPKQGSKSASDCNKNQNTCFENSGKDFPDMVENYMDYSHCTCQNIFTRQQAMVMTNTIKTYRSSLPIDTTIEIRQRIYDTVEYNDFKIYADEKNERIGVELRNAEKGQNLIFEMYSASGAVVFREQPLLRNENFFNTTGIAPGLYVAVVRPSAGEKPVLTQKIYIHKH